MAIPFSVLSHKRDYPEFSGLGRPRALACLLWSLPDSSSTNPCQGSEWVRTEKGFCVRAKDSGLFVEFRDLAQRRWR